jgi:DNA-directed RNA polymerase specialized sigma24 family protein
VPIFVLLDEAGHPLPASLQALFRPLQIRFRRHFRSIRDEAVIHNLLDHAGQRYSLQVAAGVSIETPEAFAWRILCNLTISELRRSDQIVAQNSLSGAAGERRLLGTESTMETAEDIFSRIYANQLYSQLSETELLCAVLKTAGHDSAEVAKELETSAGGVDKMVQRMRKRIRKAMVDSEKSRGKLSLLRLIVPKSTGGG